jgi:hypothetical protein
MPAEYQKSGKSLDSVPSDSAMSWTVEYVADRHFVRVVVKGIYNIDDHQRMLEDVASREFFKPGMNLLIDDTSLDFRQTNLEQLRTAGSKRIELDALIGSGKTAVLVSSVTDLARARQFQLMTSGKISGKMDIFKNEDKALRWLLA